MFNMMRSIAHVMAAKVTRYHHAIFPASRHRPEHRYIRMLDVWSATILLPLYERLSEPGKMPGYFDVKRLAILHE